MAVINMYICVGDKLIGRDQVHLFDFLKLSSQMRKVFPTMFNPNQAYYETGRLISDLNNGYDAAFFCPFILASQLSEGMEENIRRGTCCLVLFYNEDSLDIRWQAGDIYETDIKWIRQQFKEKYDTAPAFPTPVSS